MDRPARGYISIPEKEAGLFRSYRAFRTYLILLQILDSPSVSAEQMHDLSLQSPLRCVSRHRFTPSTGCGLVIGTDPGGQARVRHLASDIGIDGSKELIM